MYLDQRHITKFVKDISGLRLKDESEIKNIYIKEVEGKINLEYLQSIDISKMSVYTPGTVYESRPNKYHMFRFKIKVSPVYDNKALVLKAFTGFGQDWNDERNPNFLLFINNLPIQAFDYGHHECLITKNAQALEELDCFLFSFAGMAGIPTQLTLKLYALDLPVDRLYYNILCPAEALQVIESESIRNDTIQYILKTSELVDFRDIYSDSYYESIEKANEYIEQEYYVDYCAKDENAVVLNAIGHSHIDVAYRWPIKETRQKAVRTFSTQLKNIEDHKDFKFIASQPQLYEYVKEEYPYLIEQVKEAVKKGQWIPEGSMWLEPDTNMTSGESLVRQVIYGKRYFKEEFGVDCRMLWLPDVFGYSAALPQILKKSGIDYMTTAKLSWSEFNTFPYNTFMWQGLDGSEVFTHLITGGPGPDENGKPNVDYNAELTAENIMGAWKNYQNKKLSKRPFMTYGYGDGGGGPSRHLLEQYARFKQGIKGLPRVESVHPVEFFDTLYSEVKDNARLPKWVGELYLEYHRGTYTTRAKNKKDNRKSEILMRDVEIFSSFAHHLGLIDYDKETMFKLWKLMLLNQFHDILPGSSVEETFIDSDADYALIMKEGSSLLLGALKQLASSVKGEQLCVVYNQLAFKRVDTIKLRTDKQYNSVYDHNNNLIIGQNVQEKDKNYFIFEAKLAPMGYTVFRLSMDNIYENDSQFNISSDRLENRFLKVQFDENMNISSLYDKQQQREVVLEGERANRILAIEDKPLKYQAWDLNIYMNEKTYPVDNVVYSKIIEDGPVRKCLQVQRKFMDTVITQNICLERNSKKLDFYTVIDCKHDDYLLKASFPVDVHSDYATYDIQFGNIKRPTHWNTSWDYARFEVPGQKWADLSEDDYGVSLLNDCKYGYDIKDSTMRLTLLKSPTEPFPMSDREVHEFTYSIYPHQGDFRRGFTVDMANKLNYRPYAYYIEQGQGDISDFKSFVYCPDENVIVDTLKHAENSDDLILRVYECFNRRTHCEIEINLDINKAVLCDLLENELEDAVFEDNKLKFMIKPYEVKTFKLFR